MEETHTPSTHWSFVSYFSRSRALWTKLIRRLWGVFVVVVVIV